MFSLSQNVILDIILSIPPRVMVGNGKAPGYWHKIELGGPLIVPGPVADADTARVRSMIDCLRTTAAIRRSQARRAGYPGGAGATYPLSGQSVCVFFFFFFFFSFFYPFDNINIYIHRYCYL
jgi:hypothetical protein